MDTEFIFVSSAFKHGVTEEDIVYAYRTRFYDDPLDGDTHKFCFIGFNRAGNPIEVFYNPIDDDTIRVFHAMKCRSATINFLQ